MLNTTVIERTEEGLQKIFLTDNRMTVKQQTSVRGNSESWAPGNDGLSLYIVSWTTTADQQPTTELDYWTKLMKMSAPPA